MDLGILGRRAIVCGSSSGLGKACAFALARSGVELTLAARTHETLLATAEEIRAETRVAVEVVSADLTTEAGRSSVLAACPAPDILVTNSGGPRPGDFRNWGEAEWMNALRNNMISPIQMIRAVVDGMCERRWGRIINIASYSAKFPLPLLGLSNGARSGLIGFVSGLAREVAPMGVTINNMLPGNFGTERLRNYAVNVGASRSMPPSEVIAEMAANTPVGRIGDPAEFGAWCAFLASQFSGYVTAQNFVLDGGTYPGTY
jgi:3-oxoacyl-[acyl-carrier protein] reductase